MSNLIIEEIDKNNLKINTDKSTMNFLVEQFTAKIKNAHFHPLVKRGVWNGEINFIERNGICSKGLLLDILKISLKNNWKVKFDKDILVNPLKFEREEINSSVQNVKLYEDTQIPVIEKVLKYNNGLIKLPTSAGKSLIIISLMNLYYSKGIKNQIIIVPRSTLVEQIYEDAIKFSSHIKKEEIGKLYGENKDYKKNIIIATWQTLKLLLEFEKDFPEKLKDGLVILDEAHISSSEAKVVKNIITSFPAKYKYGFSATILEKESNKLEYYNLVSIFGGIVEKDTISNLQESGKIVKAKIDIKLLKYKKHAEISNYQEYADFIRHSTERREFLLKLIKDIRENNIHNNILILVINVDTAKEIYELFKENLGEKDVSMIIGETKTDERQLIKKEIKHNYNNVLIATEFTMGIGENIPSLSHLILYQARKSEISQIQAVGRILRLHKNKETAKVIDLCDDIIVNYRRPEDDKIIKKKYGIRHLKERIETYKKYGFNDIKTEELFIH